MITSSRLCKSLFGILQGNGYVMPEYTGTPESFSTFRALRAAAKHPWMGKGKWVAGKPGLTSGLENT